MGARIPGAPTSPADEVNMLRGYRWQLVALLLSAVLFAVSLALRSSETTPTPTPTDTPVSSTATADNIVIPPTALPDTQVSAPVTPAATGGRYREALVGRAYSGSTRCSRS
ncbi:MAG: hypothetical protein U0703_04110 [Anaerolineae bacterium]